MGKKINHGLVIDQFYGALLAGRIPGVKPQIATVVDVHRLYMAWTLSENLPQIDSAAWFARFVVSRHEIHTARRRYTNGPFIEGPHALLYLAGPVRTRCGYSNDVIGGQVLVFRSQVDAYESAAALREQGEQLLERVL